MKKIATLLIAIFLSLGALAQTVENIQVDQDGENVLVHYRIGGSTDTQTFRVTLSCSIDGGRQFFPETVFGDVHENIRGGKSNYTITWDVFEDLEEIGEVEFFVKIDLVSDLSPVSKPVQAQPQKQATIVPEGESFEYYKFFGYTGSTLSPLGFSFGSLKKWGYYFSMRGGSYKDDFETDIWATMILGINRHLLTKGIYRLHLFTGLGATYEVYEEYIDDTSWEGFSFTTDLGIINVIGRFHLTLGVEVVSDFATSPVFGVGFVF